MRTPWQTGFPPVFTHCAWQGPHGGLPDHVGYWPAKKKRDHRAAVRVCDDVTQLEVCDLIYETCEAPGERPPIVVAPAVSIHETQNVLAIGYARWLAEEMEWGVSRDIFQDMSIKRDFDTDGWFRLVHQPTFYGHVEAGRRYVLADDMCSMGGTLASLRGFIQSQGGIVICMTTLASGDGQHVDIALAERTAFGLSAKCNGEFAAAVLEELGYGIECLTEREGSFLLRCPSLERFREGVHGARNA